ncbi:hypothetical protein PPL_02452 [Heterostelium album PN500]|uniref:Uncharacterized protein n=1 Tax=Heterostelium pallidum (strain ATCC 26659 / Pp 5 / PN500) TaxID=670386 RepID=D3B245_HETP5|nr:hypothetical protein PPL_02452 [Heterostelium album PN500]EFA84420.1 hypothetical protein PPL_02452 [Heterostelium album PN500]|eukprot:XP_020436534.1 hypothetical protein PPL_02452 [Heterostelium album PN500]
MLSSVARRSSNTLYRCYASSSLIQSLNQPNQTKASLDKVFSQISADTESQVYDGLIQQYSKLNLERSCISVVSLSNVNNITLSDQSYKIIQDQWEDKNVKEEDDQDYSSLNYIHKEYLAYRESLTRRPWLKK